MQHRTTSDRRSQIRHSHNVVTQHMVDIICVYSYMAILKMLHALNM